MVIAYLVEAIKQKKFAHFAKATGVCVAGAALGILINISNLYHTWEYGKESMRGKSELVKKNSANQTNSGLERDYITQWSYGIGETWTLLIPNAKGGASVPLASNEIAMKKADPQFMQVYEQLGQYWGNQPGTSGPVYVGAFVLMLFILGLFIVKTPMKWALLAATILSILLSWGRNFMPLTDFFIDYVPMYAKFRTVASILVIAEFAIPLLAVMALKTLIEEKEALKQNMRYVYISFGLTAGVALLFALAPSLFFSSFISDAEMQALKNIPAEYLSPLMANLTQMREAMFSADCYRTVFIIVIGTALLVLYRYNKLKANVMVVVIAALCLVDMWMVNKRYLNDAMFVESSVRDNEPEMSNTDKIILQDKSLDYRVLNLASNTFNENETSYFHKSIGGYHPAKLRRYQEMIEHYIAPEMQKTMQAIMTAGGDMSKVDDRSIYPILNMLNTKYFILPLQGNQTAPVMNPYTYGNAWFVDKVTYVNNANEEIDKVGKIDLRHEAVADKQFETILKASNAQGNVSQVELVSYAPNKLKYNVSSEKGGVVVFSEIYYPGWTATIDGQKADLGRVNYILRALNVEKGKHTIELTFDPQSVHTTETIATVAFAVLLILIALIAFLEYKKRKNSNVTK